MAARGWLSWSWNHALKEGSTGSDSEDRPGFSAERRKKFHRRAVVGLPQPWALLSRGGSAGSASALTINKSSAGAKKEMRDVSEARSGVRGARGHQGAVKVCVYVD